MNSQQENLHNSNITVHLLSFIFIIFINSLFFSGYYILKDPLAFILHSQGLSLKQAYSTTTTANTLIALSSLFFGFMLSNKGTQKFFLLIGMALSTLSIFLLSLKIKTLNQFAISCYVVGGGLYFFNIVIFINKLFSKSQARLKGNYIYQIFVNIGAMIGCILFLMQLNTTNAFKYCLISSTTSVCLLAIFYKFIKEESVNKIQDHATLKIFFSLCILFFIVYFALSFEQATRLIVLISFCSLTSFIIYNALAESNNALLLFICLVFLFSIPYWIANTIIFNEFFYFLTQYVSPIKNFSPAMLIMIDPLANALFGSSLLYWQKNRIVNHTKNLESSVFLMTLAFIIFSGGLFFAAHQQKISFLYPLLTMIFFSCSEFLLQTTLNARIRDLLSQQRRGEFLATGIMRSSRAFATVIGYYLILMTTSISGENQAIYNNFHLYLIMVFIYLLSYFGYKIAKKTKLAALMNTI